MSKLYITTKFGQAPNHLLNDPSLSFKAKGLFTYMQSKPEGWDFSIERIKAQTQEGKSALQSAVWELENAGYLIRKPSQDEQGRWTGYDYHLFLEPQEKESETRETPMTGNKSTGSQSTRNHVTISKKDYSKKEVVKKNAEKANKKESPNQPLEPSPDTDSNTNHPQLSTDEKQNQSSPSPRSSSREQSGRDEHKKKQWLKDIAEGKRPEELFILCGDLDRTDQQIKQSALKALDWLDSNGKRKKDYRAFLRNWVRREYQDKDKNVYKRQNTERERWNPEEVTQGQGLM